MPTYDYECPGCKEIFEVFQSISAPPAAACPRCGKDARRLISNGVGVIFKGSGFYETDYKQKPCREKEKDAKAPPCKAGGECGKASCPAQ